MAVFLGFWEPRNLILKKGFKRLKKLEETPTINWGWDYLGKPYSSNWLG